MRHLISFIIGIFLLSPLAHADDKAIRPLIALIEKNPWLMVIGSDSPRFVLYDNGLLIYFDVEHKEYQSVTLSERELKQFLDSLPSRDFFGLNDYYSVVHATDQPTNVLIISQSDILGKKVSVYGNLRDEDDRSKTPKSFLKIYDKITTYKNKSAKKWLPEKIEVMIWPDEYAKGSLKWPNAWPDISDPRTKVRRKGEYSLFLDSSLLQDLKAFLQRRKGNQAVLINGKKYSVSYRYPFPGEPR